jgi:hypothetical protein
MKKTILTKKSNYHKIISLSAILLCATTLAGCNPKSNKDTNHHVTKTEHVKKHKKAKKTASSSSKANSSKSLSSSSSSLASSSSQSSQRVSSSSSSVATTATSSGQSAATRTATSASQQSSIQSSQQSTQHSTTAANSKTPATNTTTASTPAQTTSGFNVDGHHFDIGSFSGTGLVPSDKVYQWSSLNGWYLIDINSVAAGYAGSLGVGSAVTVNGRTYHVTHVLYNQPNNSATLSTVQSMLSSNAIGWQTCNSEGHMSNLNLWFAN